MRRSLAALAALAVMAVAGPAVAQQYPAKPIRMIVPLPAGSITDVITRLYCQHLGQALGQSIVVDNKAGGDGVIAGLEARRAAPDGYTLFMATSSPLAVGPQLQKQVPYDSVTDFTPIAYIGSASFFLVANPSLPAKSLAELVAHAKANPKKLTYATGNTMSIVSMALIAARTGMDLIHVPYRGEPQAVAELATGQTNIAVANYSTIASHLQDGKLRVLATLLPERSKLLPDVPTLAEAGSEKLPVSPWAALVGPAKLPRDIVDRIAKETFTILSRPDFVDSLLRQGVATRTSTPDETAEFIKDEYEAWGKALKAAGIEPQ